LHASAHHGALDSLDPKAYVDFLIGTMQIVTRKESWGIDWASDNQVRSRARGAEATERGPARHASAHHGATERAPCGMQVLTTAPARFATGMLENAMIEFDVNESYPMVLSLWHEELRKDVIVRTAALDYH
jgi:hypothetical protein